MHHFYHHLVCAIDNTLGNATISPNPICHKLFVPILKSQTFLINHFKAFKTLQHFQTLKIQHLEFAQLHQDAAKAILRCYHLNCKNPTMH